MRSSFSIILAAIAFSGYSDISPLLMITASCEFFVIDSFVYFTQLVFVSLEILVYYLSHCDLTRVSLLFRLYDFFLEFLLLISPY